MLCSLRMFLDTCDEVDKRCRDFIWGDTVDERTVHLVNWRQVCTPKDWGGLGLRSARLINQTALMKAGWQLITGGKDLWVKTLKAKYKCGRGILPKVNKDRACSNMWRGICHAWPEVLNNIAWRVGDGALINYWKDKWVTDEGKLQDVVLRPLSVTEENLRVANLVNSEGFWKTNVLSDLIPAGIIQKILAMAGPHANRGEDRIAWNRTADGCFSNATAYESLLDTNLKDSSGVPKKVWKWKINQDALITTSWRRRRNLDASATCPICGVEDETVLHMVRDCTRMKLVWKALLGASVPQVSFFADDLSKWLDSNLMSIEFKRGFRWPLIFGTAVLLA